MYVWDVFNVVTSYGYKESFWRYVGLSNGTQLLVYIADEYEFDPYSGFNLIDAVYYGKVGSGVDGKYWAEQRSSNKEIFEGKWNDNGLYYCNYAVQDTSVVINNKGTTTGQTVESENQTAYPKNGVSGDKWYTYSHSYSKPFDNR